MKKLAIFLLVLFFAVSVFYVVVAADTYVNIYSYNPGHNSNKYYEYNPCKNSHGLPVLYIINDEDVWIKTHVEWQDTCGNWHKIAPFNMPPYKRYVLVDQDMNILDYAVKVRWKGFGPNKRYWPQWTADLEKYRWRSEWVNIGF